VPELLKSEYCSTAPAMADDADASLMDCPAGEVTVLVSIYSLQIQKKNFLHFVSFFFFLQSWLMDPSFSKRFGMEMLKKSKKC
jgi:hypothetical protein